MEDILGKSRRPEICQARHRFWHLVHTCTELSLSAIGRLTGHDHTTVLSGIRKHSERLEDAASLPFKVATAEVG